MSKEQLVPTRITNVNGVSTTVYRRPASAARSTAIRVPAPSAQQRRKDWDLKGMMDERRYSVISSALKLASARDKADNGLPGNVSSLESMVKLGMYSAIEQVVEHFDEIPPHVDLQTFGKAKVAEKCVKMLVPDDAKRANIQENYVRSFTGSVKAEHLEGVELAIASACERDPSRRMYGIVGEIERYLSSGLTATLDSFGRNASSVPHDVSIDDYSKVVLSVNDFYRKEGYPVPENISTLSSHLRAHQQYEPLEVQKALPRTAQGSYSTDYALISAVEAYPESVDEIMNYRRERQTNDFSGEDFLDYLNGGTLKDGLL